jgi:hypothetical protein
MQHGLPITLQKTTILPRPQTGDVVADDHAALYSLAKLFVHVQNPLLQLHSTLLELTPSAYSRTHILDVQQQMQMKNRKINRISESQCVDIVTTAAWIRSLLWQYSAAHFMLSSATETEPLSLDYPFIIARDFLESLSDISVDSICTHGYGMVGFPTILFLLAAGQRGYRKSNYSKSPTHSSMFSHATRIPLSDSSAIAGRSMPFPPSRNCCGMSGVRSPGDWPSYARDCVRSNRPSAFREPLNGISGTQRDLRS